MASNGGDVSSPPTDAPPNAELTTTKPEPTPAGDAKAEQKSDEVAAPVKQVAEDLSIDNKTPKESEKPPSQAAVSNAPTVDNKPAATNAHEVISSSTSDGAKAAKTPVQEAKTASEPVPEPKTENAVADTQAAALKPENAANGTDSQQPAPSIPPTSQTTTADNTPAAATDSKPDSEKVTSVSTSAKAPASEEKPKAEKKAEDMTEQKPSEEASKPAEAAAPPPASDPSPAKSATPSESSKPSAQSPESKKAAAASPLAASKPATQQAKAVPPVATVAPMPKVAASGKNSNGGRASSATKHASGSKPGGDAPPEKKAKVSAASSKASSGNSSTSLAPAGGKTPQQILEYMDKTFEHRRRIITKEMPTIPELQQRYPDLFMHKQLLTEFQRITKIDIDQKIQEFCVRFATAVIEMARGKKGAAPVIARWEKAQQENHSLKQYWDMMTALCLLPLHFGENFADMVQEIGEDEEVVAQGKIVPVLVARGNVYRTDEFFLIAENTIVQEFEEFTIALASLYSSYWVFNMVYPESIENTYNYIQRCIVRQKEPGSIPTVCRNFTKALQKWNREKDGK